MSKESGISTWKWFRNKKISKTIFTTKLYLANRFTQPSENRLDQSENRLAQWGEGWTGFLEFSFHLEVERVLSKNMESRELISDVKKNIENLSKLLF